MYIVVVASMHVLVKKKAVCWLDPTSADHCGHFTDNEHTIDMYKLLNEVHDDSEHLWCTGSVSKTVE